MTMTPLSARSRRAVAIPAGMALAAALAVLPGPASAAPADGGAETTARTAAKASP